LVHGLNCEPDQKQVSAPLAAENRGQRLQISSDKNSALDVAALEDLLSEPTAATVAAIAALDGDIVILGVGGKMGPTLARMAKRASDQAGGSRRVIGVARFSTAGLEEHLQSWGIETYRCDLLDPHAYAKLPDAANVVYMAGMKFGATGQESLTWAMNAFMPGLVSERYRGSRMAVFSTGNIYGFSSVSMAGSLESDSPRPVGEYAQSCLGRERIFEHFSRMHGTKMSILRLYYATELRYGVLVDVAQLVFSGRPVPLSTGYLNAIWQADASAMSLQSLLHASTPPMILNIAGPELLSVRRVAESFADRWNKPVRFEGSETGDALLCNAKKAGQLFGYPTVTVDQMMTWIADWVERGGESLSKPTHFENRDGKF
jgi:nucleoside-diphosphate-sugar epimerase